MDDDVETDCREYLLYRIKCVYNVSYVMLIITLTALVLGRLTLTLYAVFAFNFLRVAAGGLHAKTLNRCAVISTVTLVIVPYILSSLIWPQWLIMTLIVVLPIIIWRYAPSAASVDKAITYDALSLKQNATIRAICLAILCVIVNQSNIHIYLLCGMYGQAVSNHPLLYYFIATRSLSYESKKINQKYPAF